MSTGMISPCAGAGADGAGRSGAARHRHHRGDRTEQGHQRRQVVRAHVQERSAARLVVEVGIGMPSFVSRDDHGGGGRDRRADQVVVHGFSSRLDARTEHGVRSAPENDTSGVGGTEHCPPLCRVEGERLFAVDALSGGDRLQGDVGVCRRDGQVEDHLDVGDADQLRNAATARTPARSPAIRLARSWFRSATATSSTESSRSSVCRYCLLMCPRPTMPSLSGSPTAGPSR